MYAKLNAGHRSFKIVAKAAREKMNNIILLLLINIISTKGGLIFQLRYIDTNKQVQSEQTNSKERIHSRYKWPYWFT